MKLRTRMVVILLATVVPVTLLFSLYRFAAEKQFSQERVAERFAERLLERSRRACEEHDGHWSPHRHEVEAFSYNVDFQPYDRDAPPFPTALRSTRLDDEPVHVKLWTGRFDGATAVRTGMGGKCELAVIYWPDRGLPRGALEGLIKQILTLVIPLVLIGLVISVPLVRRIRELAHAVLTAPQHNYRVEISGSVDDEVTELARAFNQAGERVAKTIAELQARDETLKAYLANTTHDLAIPVTVLQHRLQTLQSHVHDPQGQAALHTAMEESAYVAALVRNLNVSAKLDAHEVYFHPTAVSLHQVMERVASRHQPIAEVKGIEINLGRPESEVFVHADSTLVEQALSNLVQNAVQYGKNGGHVAMVLETLDDRFELTVLDDGPGIVSERLAVVQQARQRGQEARSRHPEGLGIGLSIVHSVCQAHGWTLELQNQERGLAAKIAGPIKP